MSSLQSKPGRRWRRRVARAGLICLGLIVLFFAFTFVYARLTAFDYDGYYRLAPGMVLIKAPGHTPGGQMVYVRLQNGAEYLLVGDVVWNSESIDRLVGRPLLMNLAMNEDQAALGSEIRALYNLARSEPIHLVVSHDGEQIEQYMRQGLLGSSFE